MHVHNVFEMTLINMQLEMHQKDTKVVN